MGTKKNNHRNTKKKKLAQKADKYELYQASVQTPEVQCKFYRRVFKQEYGRKPIILREDFCAAGAISCEWVRKNAKHQAFGYDLDPEPLEWGRQNNIAQLKPSAQERVHLVEQNALEVKGPKADVLSAENFSYFIFKTRPELLTYFKAAYANLADEGLFVLDLMGGSEVLQEDYIESRKVDGFHYLWEHARFDPISHYCTFFIHFKFRDGSKLNRAFRYDWRLWSIPEVRELLAEAGFKRADVFWEGADEDGDGNGIFRCRKQAESDPAWIAYVVGVK